MFAVSTYLKNRLLRLGVPTTVTRLPVDSEAFNSRVAPLERANVSLLHPSRLVEEKGSSLSLDLLELLLGEGVDVNLTIMETPRVFDISDNAAAYTDKIKCMIADLNLGTRIKLLTASVIEMRAVYEASDIVLYPSIFPEPYGLAVLEAMSCERPVVASAAGGLRENIQHGGTGLLFRPGHLRELYNLAKKLILQPDLGRRIGKDARQYVVQERSVRHFAKSMIDVYRAGCF